MPTEIEEDPSQDGPDRWTLIRDVAVLQVKLVFDGLRDLILVPVSIVTAIISLTRSGDKPGPQFYDLMRLGKESEQWINLFGAVENVPDSAPDSGRFPSKDIDSVVSRVESFVIDEYKKGGLTTQAKDHFDKVLDSLRRKGRESGSRKDSS
jgi:hypothetical protein